MVDEDGPQESPEPEQDGTSPQPGKRKFGWRKPVGITVAVIVALAIIGAIFGEEETDTSTSAETTTTEAPTTTTVPTTTAPPSMPKATKEKPAKKKVVKRKPAKKKPKKEPKPISDYNPKSQDQKISAKVMCEGFVKRYLKSPSSASFPTPGWDAQLNDLVQWHAKGKYYRVAEQYEADNSFGASQQGMFFCEIKTPDQGKNWKLSALEMPGQGGLVYP